MSNSSNSASSSISGSNHSKYDVTVPAAVAHKARTADASLPSLPSLASSALTNQRVTSQSIASFLSTLLRIVLGLGILAMFVVGGGWAVETAKSRFDPVSIILTVPQDLRHSKKKPPTSLSMKNRSDCLTPRVFVLRVGERVEARLLVVLLSFHIVFAVRVLFL